MHLLQGRAEMLQALVMAQWLAAAHVLAMAMVEVLAW